MSTRSPSINAGKRLRQKASGVEVVWTGSLFERIGGQILCHGKRLATFTPAAVGERDQHLHGI
jgi:hypothetical protein